ncbi:MAG: TIGR01777 family oxidoreductase [Sulfuricurvum sp.]
MEIAICGMSGFVGSALKRYCEEKGDHVIGISIRADTKTESLVARLEGCDVLINLAGASIMGRWSTHYKQVLRESRLETTRKLVEAFQQCQNPPRALLNASAVGIYDDEHQHDEDSWYFGDDFLATLVREWERSALLAHSERTRVCLMRFGVVYGRGGGAMAKMLPPFQMGLGGKIGDGFQMISWIHIDDLVRACRFLMEHENLEGVFNFTAPEPITNYAQTKTMGHVLQRPVFFDLPNWLIQLVFGEGSSVMLDSKEVYPKRLQEAGFEFRHPTFDSAMEEIAHAPA